MYKNVLQSIGNTPIVKVGFDFPATFLAKLEYLNPGDSIKDRSALYMIEEAERIGQLKPGGTIIDASSGNTRDCNRNDRCNQKIYSYYLRVRKN